MLIADIVFIQDSQDFDMGRDTFFELTPKQQAEYLSCWDYGDYDKKRCPSIPKAQIDNMELVRGLLRVGESDTVIRVRRYYLILNNKYGYVALHKLIPHSYGGINNAKVLE